MKYFQGYVYVQLTGYAPERFLNLCGNHNILIWNLKPYGEGYTFCISVKGFRALKPILRKTRTHIKILKKVGAPFTTYRYRKRKIFFMGIFLFGILLYYLSGFVWNIEINGNSYLSNEVILDFLAEEECSFGTKKSDISCEALEEALRSRHSEVIWTSIKIYGTKMTVDVQENLLPEEDYEKKDDTVYDIVASMDGTISEIVTRSGNPLVSAGTEVKKGDVLVSGRLNIMNDDGEVAEYLYQSSDADIIAKVTLPYKDTIAADYIAEIESGENKEHYILTVGSIVLESPFFNNSYEYYKMNSDTWQLHVTDNFYLPIWLTKENYQKTDKVKKTYTEKEIRQIVTNNLGNYLKDLEEKGIQIIGKNVIIERKGGNYLVNGIIDAYESIVSYQTTGIMNITSEERQQDDGAD